MKAKSSAARADGKAELGVPEPVEATARPAPRRSRKKAAPAATTSKKAAPAATTSKKARRTRRKTAA